MANIAQYLNDHLVTKTVDAIVDETQAFLRARSSILADACPIREYSSRNFLGLLMNEINPVASIVAYGQEIPLSAQGEFKRLTAEMAKFAVSRMYDENIQWQMHEARQLAQLKGVYVQDMPGPDNKVIPGSENDLAMNLFGSIKKMVMAVMDKLDAATWQGLQTGAVDLGADPRTRQPLRLDYKDPGANYNHFPAALVATGNADGTLNRWSDYQNANGLQVLYNANDTYIETNGFPLDCFAMGRRLMNHLMQQQSTKDAVTQVRGASVGTVSLDMLKVVLEARGIPEIKIVEDRYYTADEFGTYAQARFINDNVVVGIKKEMGVRAIGATMESSPDTTGDGSFMPNPKPGVYVTTYEKQKQPPTDVTYAVMTGLPVFMNPKLFFAQTVN